MDPRSPRHDLRAAQRLGARERGRSLCAVPLRAWIDLRDLGMNSSTRHHKFDGWRMQLHVEADHEKAEPLG